MNIKTFKNELNPMFIEKAKKIYLLARTNGNTLEVNNNIYSFKSDYESKVRLDNKLNIISTECNCKSKYLYCFWERNGQKCFIRRIRKRSLT